MAWGWLSAASGSRGCLKGVQGPAGASPVPVSSDEYLPVHPLNSTVKQQEKNDPLHIIGGKTEVNRSSEVHLDAHGKLLVAPKAGGGFQTTDLVQCQHSSLPGQ